ncbi:MAG TPA: quinol:electron acceptor oxidoreductase subunit ActD [Anaeromyxobacteraceae bacterium]|nr:quinol:electron acceptor oxidoreductase subunit ActD [Anaeromyxobacteraceae bacterium]
MRTEPGVLATFDEPAAAARAIRSLRGRGIRDLHAGLPAPFPEVVAALGKPRSAIDYATMPGALLGLVLGILLPVLTSLSWPLVTGGKEIVSLPAFVVIIFEMTVLVGSIANLVAVTVRSFLGGGTGAFPRGERFNGDRLAVFAAGGGEEAERVFREAGALEVRRVA